MKKLSLFLFMAFVINSTTFSQKKTDTTYYTKIIESFYAPLYKIIDTVAKKENYNVVYEGKRPEYAGTLLCEKGATLKEKLGLCNVDDFFYRIKDSTLFIYEHHIYNVNPVPHPEHSFIKTVYDNDRGVELLQFQNITVATLLDNVTKFYGMAIKNKINKMPTETVSGFFPINYNTWLMLSVICIAHKLYYTFDTNYVVTIKNIKGSIESYWDTHMVKDSPYVKSYYEESTQEHVLLFNHASDYLVFKIMAEANKCKVIFKAKEKPLSAGSGNFPLSFGTNDELLNFFCEEHGYCYHKEGEKYVITDCSDN